MAAMIRVHHLENSRSQRILWLLEELGLPYEVKRYERDKRTMLAPPELRRVHPLGKSPVIEDLDARGGGGRIVAETGAIVEYLVEKADGRLGPPPQREAVLLYRQFLHYAEGSMMPPLLAMLVVRRLGLLGRLARAPLQRMLDSHLDWLESELAERDWFAGDSFTAADVMMSFPLEASRHRAGLDERRPNLTAWLDRIHARPAYREALRKGGPYAYA
jgi:glutathione S-transferase